MEIRSLGYVVVGSSKINEWADFSESLLGMQVSDRSTTSLVLRMDERCHRMSVRADLPEGAFITGWEVDDPKALDALAARLEGAQIKVRRASPSLAAQRGVTDVISFHDPIGNEIEAFFGALADPSPFKPGRPISGFRTGNLGMGHAVLLVSSIERALPFYRDVLGLRISDYMLKPFKAYFFHANARHHSLAMIEAETNGLHHLMIETSSLDDVGQGYDIALTEGGRVGTTLGRHSNDFMTSFYARTPSPCLMEYGWGGRSIDPASWHPVELDCGPSLWGHEREWLPEPKREIARQLRMKAAKDARRAPVYVLPGQFVIGAGDK